MRHFALRRASLALTCFSLVLIGCATTGEVIPYEEEPVIISEAPAPDEAAVPEEVNGIPNPLTVEIPTPDKGLAEVIVSAPAVRERHEEIRDLINEARTLLSGEELEYVFVAGKKNREFLRGRPVIFALWSETKEEWTIASLEIPIPAKWKPGGSPLTFHMVTKGITARHVWGTGAERLMFRFSKDGEDLKVYGRKFPVFDGTLLQRGDWRATAEAASPITYLPFTKDTLDPSFIEGGREYLLSTAKEAREELCASGLYSLAFPGTLLCEVTTPEVIATLAVIEQMDDYLYFMDATTAMDGVLNHYGLKREEAYRFSVSDKSAIGPMQFTNGRGNGTYAEVVRRCPGTGIDPDFRRGAMDLKNAMKAAICLFDIELSQTGTIKVRKLKPPPPEMRRAILDAYLENKEVLGIFPVAAYNGGPRNVLKLYFALRGKGLRPDDLRAAPDDVVTPKGKCPCLWKEGKDGSIVPVKIPGYNRENPGYIEKYQKVLKLFNGS